MNAPIRIQRSRRKGWRMPPNTIFVGRPSRHGNPWPIDKLFHEALRAWDWSGSTSHAVWIAFYNDLEKRAGFSRSVMPIFRGVAVELFDALCEAFRRQDPAGYEAWLAPLRGQNVACWCPLDQHCHGDILLRRANPEAFPRPRPGSPAPMSLE